MLANGAEHLDYRPAYISISSYILTHHLRIHKKVRNTHNTLSCLDTALLLPYSCLTPALILPYSCLTPAMLLSCFYLTLALILPCSFLPCFCINPTQLLSSPSLAPWPLFASFLLLVSTLTLLYSAVLVLLWSCVADVLPVIFLMSYTSPPIPILLLPCPSCRSLRNVHDNSSLRVQCHEISWPQLFG